MQLFGHLSEIPEGYAFKLKSFPKDLDVNFDLRKYKCNSLKRIWYKDKYAAIQFKLLISLISYIFNNTDNIVVFPDMQD